MRVWKRLDAAEKVLVSTIVFLAFTLASLRLGGVS
jgi:hypothetical protein